MTLRNIRRGSSPQTWCPYANWLEARLPLRAFATLTFPRSPSVLQLDCGFRAWVQAIQRHERGTLGYIRAYESEPRRHVHVVLVAPGDIDLDHATLAWRNIAAPRFRAAARVEKYKYGIGGLDYMMKSVGASSEDVQFSPNLSAFAPCAGKRFFGNNATERRQMRRIMKACSVTAIAKRNLRDQFHS